MLVKGFVRISGDFISISVMTRTKIALRSVALIRDEEIIQNVLEGDVQSYRELMQRHQVRAFRLALRILSRREDAEDAVQEAFISAYKNLDTCRHRHQFWPWLRKILLNACLSKLSCEMQVEELDDESHSAQCLTDSVEVQVLNRVQSAEMGKIIDGLPAAYRAVIVLRYEEDLSYKEIAEVISEPVSVVQVRLHRAKKMLAVRMGVIAHVL